MRRAAAGALRCGSTRTAWRSSAGSSASSPKPRPATCIGGSCPSAPGPRTCQWLLGRRRPILPASRARIPVRASARTPMVGREAELRWLEDFRRRAIKDSPNSFRAASANRQSTRQAGRRRSQTCRRRPFLAGAGRERAFSPSPRGIEALRPALAEDLVKHLSPAIRRDLARLFPSTEDGPANFRRAGGWPSDLRGGRACTPATLRKESPIVVIEDLHWCDEMSARLLRFLPRRLEGRPVLLVATARPEEMPEDPVRRVVLDMLSRDPLGSRGRWSHYPATGRCSSSGHYWPRATTRLRPR